VTDQSLGEAIRDLRQKSDMSLRDLAKKANISPPFLSDIESGKRYPSDETLRDLGRILKVSFDELKKYDHRESVSDLRKMIETNPSLGFAFRSAVSDYKQGKLTIAELERRVKGGKKRGQ